MPTIKVWRAPYFFARRVPNKRSDAENVYDLGRKITELNWMRKTHWKMNRWQAD